MGSASFASWGLHMAMLILFSSLYGKLFGEWKGSDSRPRTILYLGMGVILVATLIIATGNHLGKKHREGESAPTAQDAKEVTARDSDGRTLWSERANGLRCELADASWRPERVLGDHAPETAGV